MDQNNLFIFVYGTLRKDCPTGAHQQYLHGATFISSAVTRGSLFLIDYYPGLVIGSHNNETWVTGEVYALKDNQQLQLLDHYEGCASDSVKPHEYIRKLIDVKLPDGKTFTTWSYIYQKDTQLLKFLPSGDFLVI